MKFISFSCNPEKLQSVVSEWMKGKNLTPESILHPTLTPSSTSAFPQVCYCFWYIPTK